MKHEDNKKALETLGIEIPKGWRFVRYGTPREMEYFIDWDLKVRLQKGKAGKGVGFIVEMLRSAKKVSSCLIEQAEYEEGKRYMQRELFHKIQKRELPKRFKINTDLELYGFKVFEDWIIERYDAFSDEYICKCINGVTLKERTHRKNEDDVFELVSESE